MLRAHLASFGASPRTSLKASLWASPKASLKASLWASLATYLVTKHWGSFYCLSRKVLASCLRLSCASACFLTCKLCSKQFSSTVLGPTHLANTLLVFYKLRSKQFSSSLHGPAHLASTVLVRKSSVAISFRAPYSDLYTLPAPYSYL